MSKKYNFVFYVFIFQFLVLSQSYAIEDSQGHKASSAEASLGEEPCSNSMQIVMRRAPSSVKSEKKDKIVKSSSSPQIKIYNIRKKPVLTQLDSGRLYRQNLQMKKKKEFKYANNR